MKRVIQLNIALVFFILPLILMASNPKEFSHTKSKTINKEFAVNKNALLKVNNSYGNLDIVTWEENRIVFEITITASGNNEEKTQEKLNEINVNFSGTRDLVSAETTFGNKKSGSWWNWGSNSKIKMKINYKIKMPITNAVNLSNDYGNINLGKLKGRAQISCDYGKITTKELMGDNNQLSFDYTKGCYFEYVKSGKINADYSDYTLSKTKDITINADYTNSKIELAEDVSFNCDYGNITIDAANNINGKGDYLTTVIGDIYNDVTLNADYGSIKIKQLTENARNVTIKSDYVGINIGYVNDYNFNFDIKLEYGSLRDDNDLVFIKKRIESTDKYYNGYRGNQTSGNTISIESDYGSVTLKQN
ncbi:hypothetical protein [Algibacter mikhailovii]|uniref:Adhesin domain-containing protein n=1 Tax=Algibacter mikhailovii TaxID=425498 RepID=A0A918R5U5_9FLAO|nr:hypothetical protein [Algibacter mikhailovii]GGZ86947.1 hypothetical protein GCM10007028_26330 [Algibacter mikhailovii]